MPGGPQQSDQRKRDWWDKASVISHFLSSVVIVVIGMAITASIQQAQIDSSKSAAEAQLEAANVHASDAKRLQEGQLTAQLLKHLASGDDTEREIAVVALRESVPVQIYDEVVAILARSDASPEVRKAAIKQLGKSESQHAAKALGSIVNDPVRPVLERDLALDTVRGTPLAGKRLEPLKSQVTAIFANASSTELAFQSPEIGGGAFGHFVEVGLRGEADFDQDGSVTVAELANFLVDRVPAYTREMFGQDAHPVTSIDGQADFPLVAESPTYEGVSGVIVSVSDYLDSRLGSLMEDHNGRSLMDIFTSPSGVDSSGLRLLIGAEATRANILDALSEAARGSSKNVLTLFYFSGHGFVNRNGQPAMMAYDSLIDRESTQLSLSQLLELLASIKSQAKAIFFDSAYAGTGVSSVTQSSNVR